jgi:predicted solute-binding protein
MWIARPGIETSEMTAVLSSARDRGLRHLKQIAERSAPALEISTELAYGYLRENLHFALGREEREGLQRFYELCVANGLAPRGLEFGLEVVAHGSPAN